MLTLTTKSNRSSSKTKHKSSLTETKAKKSSINKNTKPVLKKLSLKIDIINKTGEKLPLHSVREKYDNKFNTLFLAKSTIKKNSECSNKEEESKQSYHTEKIKDKKPINAKQARLDAGIYKRKTISNVAELKFSKKNPTINKSTAPLMTAPNKIKNSFNNYKTLNYTFEAELEESSI